VNVTEASGNGEVGADGGEGVLDGQDVLGLSVELLSKHQKYVKEQTGSSSDKPVFFVFHGGSGSSKEALPGL
jgi:fructose/tagatose bisphosphate aldolase